MKAVFPGKDGEDGEYAFYTVRLGIQDVHTLLVASFGSYGSCAGVQVQEINI